MVVLLLFGCIEENDTTSASGIVLYTDIEGGIYGIVTDSGEHYLPENLSSEFKKDSLRISFEGIITDRPTSAMWGRTITLTKVVPIQ